MADTAVNPGAAPMRRLTVLFDDRCGVCRRCQEWLAHQPAHVELELLAATGDEAQRRYGQIPQLGSELVVVGDGGQTWIGPAAFVMCLWALRDWRHWSYRLSSPALAGSAERFFIGLSRRRRGLWSGAQCVDETCSCA